MTERTARQDEERARFLERLATFVFFDGLLLAALSGFGAGLVGGVKAALCVGIGMFMLVALIFFLLTVLSSGYHLRAENKRMRAIREINDWEHNGRQI